MTTIRLSGQKTIRNTIAPRIQTLKDAMDLRKEIWNKLPNDKKIAWIKSDRDPVMQLAWSIYKYLRNNFFGEETDEYL